MYKDSFCYYNFLVVPSRSFSDIIFLFYLNMCYSHDIFNNFVILLIHQHCNKSYFFSLKLKVVNSIQRYNAFSKTLIMPVSPKRKKSRPNLPKHIRDELRMAVALRGCSYWKNSGPKTLTLQANELYDFFHGKGPSRPSQMLLLTQGILQYFSLFEVHQHTALRKNATESSTKRLRLEGELSRDRVTSYIAEVDIRNDSLEKKKKLGHFWSLAAPF